jgi:CSLREA domain-containing protein
MINPRNLTKPRSGRTLPTLIGLFVTREPLTDPGFERVPELRRRAVAGCERVRSRSIFSLFLLVVGIAALSLGQGSAAAATNATLTVNSTDDVDDGSCDAVHCSLREAINAANAQAGLDTIGFDISGPAPHSIFLPLSQHLPYILGPTTIDGTTAPDFTGAPVVELRGDLAPGGHVDYGLWFFGGDSTLRGLVVSGFRFAAVVFETGGSNTIQGNYIGTDASGTVAVGNGQDSIYILNSANNLIGGTLPGARNVVVNNYPAGRAVDLWGPGSHDNVVQGNFVGTDVTGEFGLSYDPTGAPKGVYIIDATNNLIGGTTAAARNVISGSTYGVYIESPGGGSGTGATGNVIEGNYIGTDATGTKAISNTEGGVVIGSPDNTIGVPGAGNLISGNGEGIGSEVPTVIQGNLIGTDRSGLNPISNAVGIAVRDDSVVGGTSVGSGNVISGNSGTALFILSSNMVQGNKIGTDISGLHALSNNSGIVANGSDNVIGGTENGARNIISGSAAGAGLQICFDSFLPPGFCIEHDQRNRIQGNYIGTDVTGTVAIGNFGGGFVLSGSHNLVGGVTSPARNLISGNGGGGLFVTGSDNQVLGNFIGTNASGTGPLGNTGGGVAMSGANQMLGGPSVADRNLISGNDGDGVYLSGDSRGLGNFIGTDVNGTAALANSGNGVTLNSQATLGGATVGMGNLVSGNGGNGVLVEGENNLVRGNFIGTDAGGLNALGNGAHGIEIRSERNLIGGRLGGGNTIAYNGGAGVVVQNRFRSGLYSRGNGIFSNSIHSNAALGIDLVGFAFAADGVTVNDPGDADVGGNDLQNFPVLTSAVSGTGSTIVQGTLNSTPSTSGITYRLEFFSNPGCDPSGFGQGKTFVGASDVTTDPEGNVSFVVTLSGNSPAGSVITSTATDPANSTSEFSGCITLSQAAINISLAPASATNPIGSTHSVTATVTRGTSPVANRSVAFHVDNGPNTGASATVATDANGHASFTYTDSGGAGTDSISATVTDDAGVLKTATATKNWVAPVDPAISAHGTPISATEASPFSGQVASFTDPDAAATASEYSARIDWGDATPASVGAISGGSGTFSVSGVHTYTSEGVFTVTTTITDVDNTSNMATTTSTATVADAAISASGTSISATEGSAFSGKVAGFTDPDTTGTPAEYSASINWGDGTAATAGAITGSGGTLTVSGSHTYAEEGTYSVRTTVTDADNASNTATAVATATVADAALSAKPACPATSGQNFSGPAATFTDAASPSGTLSDFSATLTWGDGTSSAGVVSGPGPYTVSGAHTYSGTGPFTILILITDVGGSRASTSCTPIVYGFATGGRFVVGDQSATGSVFFWGAQWEKNNSLSGGTAPSSFKGFVDGATQPACGLTWTTDPGNSSHPPPTVPAYMAVIVSSSVTKSGSLISGNTVHVVVVKTKPGYGPNPGHAGTGTVVAIIC